jgi:replication factor A1
VDEAGEIKIALWGDDIKKVKNGSKIIIKNGYTNTFKGEVSLGKGKYGEIIIKEY